MKNTFPDRGPRQPRWLNGRLGRDRTTAGFTFAELVVVTLTLAILAAVLLPVLNQARVRARGASCLGNLKQLTLGWIMYAGDNSGRLVPNGEFGTAGVTTPGDPLLQPGAAKAQWCPGSMRDNGATALPYGNLYIQAGLLYPFVNSLKVYKCAADPGIWPHPSRAGSQPRVRSVAMNCWLNPVGRSWNQIESYQPDKAQTVFLKSSDLNPAPGAGQTWVFIDENPATIEDGFFVCDRAIHAWINVPAAYHAGAGGLAFADGHGQLKPWADPKVRAFDNYNYTGSAITLDAGDYAGDLQWLQQASTVMTR